MTNRNHSNMKIIIINAVAAKISGAVTILNSMLDYCEHNLDRSSYHIIHFTQLDGFKNSDLIENRVIPVFSWIDRIKWDNGGLKNYCDKYNIKPDIIISKQNTCTKWAGVPQLVYFDQLITLIPYHWNIFNRQDFKLWLYAHPYKFFVNKNNENAEYVVQLNCIKDAFCKTFKNISCDKVHVVVPDVSGIEKNSIDIDGAQKLLTEKSIFGRKLFIYPATPFSYKNHKIILTAVKQLDREISQHIAILFTVPSNGKIARAITELNLSNLVFTCDMLPYKTLLGMYELSTALLFPSKIESYGLPLREASGFGLPILAADRPYSREVLADYEGVSFIPADDATAWMTAIQQIAEFPIRRFRKLSSEASSWGDFMDIAIRKCPPPSAHTNRTVIPVCTAPYKYKHNKKPYNNTYLWEGGQVIFNPYAGKSLRERGAA